MTMQKPIVKDKDAPDLGVFWSDPFYLEQQLSEEERMLMDASKPSHRKSCNHGLLKPFKTKPLKHNFLKKWEKWVS